MTSKGVDGSYPQSRGPRRVPYRNINNAGSGQRWLWTPYLIRQKGSLRTVRRRRDFWKKNCGDEITKERSLPRNVQGNGTLNPNTLAKHTERHRTPTENLCDVQRSSREKATPGTALWARPRRHLHLGREVSPTPRLVRSCKAGDRSANLERKQIPVAPDATYQEKEAEHKSGRGKIVDITLLGAQEVPTVS